MNDNEDPKIREIAVYLAREFPGFAVDLSEGSQGDPLFRLKSPEQEHVVIVQKPFLDEILIESIQEQLDEFRLAATVRDIGQFPIVVSNNGCIFG